MEIHYLRPAMIDDIVVVRTTLEAVGGARIILAQTLLGDGAELVRARVAVALVGTGGRALRLPPAIRNAFGPPLAISRS
jgi:acyl-CoA thioester hydrolase